MYAALVPTSFYLKRLSVITTSKLLHPWSYLKKDYNLVSNPLLNTLLALYSLTKPTDENYKYFFHSYHLSLNFFLFPSTLPASNGIKFNFVIYYAYLGTLQM